MTNITKTTKTILFASLIAAMILPFSGMNYATAQSMTNEQEKQFDELGTAILVLQIQNQQLSEISENSFVADILQDNQHKIDLLQVKFNSLIPKSRTVEITPALEAKMNDAIIKLMESDFPLLGLGIDHRTGLLNVEVDIDQATNIDQEIRQYVGRDIPLSIEYIVDDVRFQGACAGRQGFCNPVIGASFAEEGGIAQDCTLSIAAKRGTVNGVVMPHHCNTGHNDMWQAKKGTTGHYLGPLNIDGGAFCDCDFVKSNSRSINTGLVNWDGNNVAVAGPSDLAAGDAIFMIGSVTGIDFGTIDKVNQIKFLDGNWFTDLYEISGINFVTGDSGAPIIKQGTNVYGGMNIAGGSVNYGHDWTFMKGKLGLN